MSDRLKVQRLLTDLEMNLREREHEPEWSMLASGSVWVSALVGIMLLFLTR